MVGVVDEQQEIAKAEERVRPVGGTPQRLVPAMHIAHHVHPHAHTLGSCPGNLPGQAADAGAAPGVAVPSMRDSPLARRAAPVSQPR